MLPAKIRAPGLKYLLVLGIALAAAPALAAEVTYPPAMRVGIVPPPDFVASPRFPGFEHNDKAATIILTELPGYTFEAIDKEVTDDLMKQPGVLTRENVDLEERRQGFPPQGHADEPAGPGREMDDGDARARDHRRWRSSPFRMPSRRSPAKRPCARRS